MWDKRFDGKMWLNAERKLQKSLHAHYETACHPQPGNSCSGSSSQSRLTVAVGSTTCEQVAEAHWGMVAGGLAAAEGSRQGMVEGAMAEQAGQGTVAGDLAMEEQEGMAAEGSEMVAGRGASGSSGAAPAGRICAARTALRDCFPLQCERNPPLPKVRPCWGEEVDVGGGAHKMGRCGCGKQNGLPCNIASGWCKGLVVANAQHYASLDSTRSFG